MVNAHQRKKLTLMLGYSIIDTQSARNLEFVKILFFVLSGYIPAVLIRSKFPIDA